MFWTPFLDFNQLSRGFLTTLFQCFAKAKRTVDVRSNYYKGMGGSRGSMPKLPKTTMGETNITRTPVKRLEWQLPTCEQTRSGKPPKYQVVITLQPLHLGLKYHHTTTVISCFTQRQWHLRRSRRRGGYGVKLGTKVCWYQTQLVSIFSSRKWVVPVIWMVRWSSLFSWTISRNWGIWLAGCCPPAEKVALSPQPGSAKCTGFFVGCFK